MHPSMEVSIMKQNLVMIPLGQSIPSHSKNLMKLISRMMQASQIKAFITRTLMATKINNSSPLRCQRINTNTGIALRGWTQGSSPALLQIATTTVGDSATTTNLLTMDPLFRIMVTKAIKIISPL